MLLLLATWIENNFRSNPSKTSLFISGRNFTANENATVAIKDRTAIENFTLNKYLLYGSLQNDTKVLCNDVAVPISKAVKFNAIIIDSSKNNNIRVSVNSGLSVYGISLEAPTGVIVDNFSFRGNSGNEFATYDTAFFANH